MVTNPMVQSEENCQTNKSKKYMNLSENSGGSMVDSQTKMGHQKKSKSTKSYLHY